MGGSVGRRLSFHRSRPREGPRSGRTKWKLVPEGQGEELESVPAVDCTIVKSEATNKVSDADKEAWQVFDHRYA